MGWTRITYDQDGREVERRSFNAALPWPWGTNTNDSSGAVTTSYNENFTTVVDEAGKSRTLEKDALGRLTSVTEPGTVMTTYGYDALDNPTSVTQGTRARSFTYTSLGLLKNATNPESGFIQYTYYPNGNLETKTDALGVVTTMTYSDGVTPAVSYLYDQDKRAPGDPQPNYHQGRLSSVSTSASATVYNRYL